MNCLKCCGIYLPDLERRLSCCCETISPIVFSQKLSLEQVNGKHLNCITCTRPTICFEPLLSELSYMLNKKVNNQKDNRRSILQLERNVPNTEYVQPDKVHLDIGCLSFPLFLSPWLIDWLIGRWWWWWRWRWWWSRCQGSPLFPSLCLADYDKKSHLNDTDIRPPDSEQWEWEDIRICLEYQEKYFSAWISIEVSNVPHLRSNEAGSFLHR